MLQNFEIQFNERQTEELAKHCMELSRITFGTLVIGFFSEVSEPIKLFLVLVGLTFFVGFSTLGLALFGKLK